MSEVYNFFYFLRIIKWNEISLIFQCVETLITRIDHHEKRSLDSIAAKAFFYLCLIYETKNKLDQLRA